MANLNLAKSIIAGHITDNIELKQGNDGKLFCRFNVAVNRKRNGENKADYFTLVAYNEKAKTISSYFSKGSSIFIIAEVQNNNYEKDGKMNYSFSFIVNEFAFVDSKNEVNASNFEQKNIPKLPNPYNGESESIFDDIANFGGDENLPF